MGARHILIECVAVLLYEVFYTIRHDVVFGCGFWASDY
jgi:hypothetical protein